MTTKTIQRNRRLARVLAAILLASGLALAPPAQVRAQAEAERQIAVEKHPGFVDFDDVGSMFGEDALDVHISVKDAMLRLVAAAVRENEPDLATMIGDLRAVEVMVYDIDGDTDRQQIRLMMKGTAERLREKAWEPAVDIRLQDQGGFLYFRFGEGGGAVAGNPVGLAGIFLDGDEAVFINIVGTIDPTLLGRLAARFNISLLDELDAALPKTPAQRNR